jgi:hypothetical protein
MRLWPRLRSWSRIRMWTLLGKKSFYVLRVTCSETSSFNHAIRNAQHAPQIPKFDSMLLMLLTSCTNCG